MIRYALPLLLMLVASCRDDTTASVPPPVSMTEDALGYYCQMIVLDHEGPKAQIHLEGQDAPIFFSQVRDGLAYLKGPERTAPITAFYVSDMSNAQSWENPGNDNWIAAKDAYFVVGSDAVGGMGAPELVPFGKLEDAKTFAAKRGGKVVRLNEIPADAVLGAVDHNP